MTLTRSYSCDSCSKNISDDSDAEHRLVLIEDHFWRKSSSAVPPQLLDRDQHFCSMKCLDQWLVNRT